MSDERSSTDNVPGGTPNFPTVSSLKSEDSTEQLICKTPQKNTVKRGVSVSSKSVEAGSDDGNGSRRLIVALGVAQVGLGVLLVGSGALAVVKGAALSRVGAGLWAGGLAVVAGVVGVIAGLNDCYALNGPTSGGLLTAFLALSLLCLACGNSAAVLAAAGLRRDSLRDPDPLDTFQDEMQAWTPVLTNIALLIVASLHCLVCVISIYYLSKRVCSCFRPKQPFDHNQFSVDYKTPCVFHVDEMKKAQDQERQRGHELCKELEAKLQNDAPKRKKEECEFGSANSKEHLVNRWLGRHGGAAGRPLPRHGVRKTRKPPPGPVVLVPAHPASTLGRMPVGVVVPPRPYATLPLPPAHYPPPAQLYYPIHDTRIRRRRSPREARHERRRRVARERDSLTRSLERIHRKRRADRERLSDADLKRTYTGLDRAYAEQFIAVCDSSRLSAEQHDSLASTATSDSNNSQDTQ
ncbi:uncharacterized protein LOC125057820 [Pieris napi]|uniref:uncharacterized protein LOC125057820 n=1 Tax=Pieris napi TaxID=78633 RepID=UPI001FB953BF|nr:uncharacterized protein LOC125057820 [Pieris napi]